MVRKGRTTKVSKSPMKGKSNTKRDRQRQALPPGKRISSSGRRYTETRKNRADRGRWE